MEINWIPVLSLLLLQCSVIVLSSPVGVTSPTVEYLDSPSATEVVFDESGIESMGNDSIDENIGTTEVPDDTTVSDDEPHTTSLPCETTDLENSSDCHPSANAVEIHGEEKTVKTDDDAEKEEATTASPKET